VISSRLVVASILSKASTRVEYFMRVNSSGSGRYHSNPSSGTTSIVRFRIGLFHESLLGILQSGHYPLVGLVDCLNSRVQKNALYTIVCHHASEEFLLAFVVRA